MAQRTVSVTLVANIGSFVSSMARAGASVSGLGKLAVGALGVAGIAGGFAAAVGAASEFESAMSGVQAATMASAATLGELRDAAMEAGAATQYSATEAADAIKEMAKAGVSTADIMGGGLTGALNLAAAGQLEVAQAAEIASIAMTQFNLSGEDLPHVADLLAAGAGKAMGEVSDLGAALNQAGLVASAAGLSIEETTGSLSAFASAGLIGSDAGTSLKSMLQRLQNPSKEAATTMADLGISMYDANGEFVGMEALAGQMRDGMQDLTPAVRDAAMATIFGSDAVRAANVLYSEGSDGIADWTAAVNDSGYAAEQAAILNDNLAGDIERLGGAWDTLLIQLGSGSQGPLRNLTQGMTDLLDVISDAATGAGDLASELGDRLAPFFEAVTDIGGDLWKILTEIADALGPIAAGLAKIAAGAIITALNGLGTVLSEVTGFLADNAEIAFALAAMLAVTLAGGIGVVTTAFGVFIGLPIITFVTGTLLPAFGAVATFLTGGFTAAVGTASAALGTFLATAAPLAAVGAIAVGIYKLVNMSDAADDAREEVEDLWAAVGDAEGNSEKLSILGASVDTLKAKIADLRDEMGDKGFWESVWEGPFEDRFDTQALDEYKQALADTKAEMSAINETASTVGATLGMTRDEVIALADAHEIDLSQGVTNVLGPMAGLVYQLAEEDRAARGATAASDAFAAATESTKEQVDKAKEAVDAFKLSLDILTGANVTMIQVESAFQSAVAAADGALDELNGTVLDGAGHLNLQSESGRAAADVLLDVRDSGNQLIATMIEQGGTLEDVQAADAQLRESFIRSAGQMGISGQAAENLADDILGIPSERETQITADTNQATGAVAALQSGINNLKGRTVVISAEINSGNFSGSTRLMIPAAAEGGMIPGPYVGPKADNVLIRANPREFMQPVASVDYYGADFMEALRTRRIPRSAIRGYAEGGSVGAAPASIRAELDARAYNTGIDAMASRVAKALEPVQGMVGALNWARTQVGKPYIWGGVGPVGYDCSGFMSAITNVVRGRSPYARVGATSSFPWAGFSPGYGSFTIGSTPNAGGGIGHMAGTLLGVNVESTGGVGVKVGGSARGANDSLFGTRAHLATYDQGGPLYPGLTLAYNGTGKTEWVSKEFSGGGRGGGAIDHKQLARELGRLSTNITVTAPPDQGAIVRALVNTQRAEDFLRG